MLAVTAFAGCGVFPFGADAPDAPIPRRVAALQPVDALLLGEQHDAPEHHAIERETVEALVARGHLAALALEMAEEGRSTAALAPPPPKRRCARRSTGATRRGPGPAMARR